MNRWHSPPAELYALVEHTPATVLLESARPPDLDSAPQPLTRLFTAPLRVCIAHHPAELPALFATIESAVAQGHFAAGYFAYECGFFFEPAAAPLAAKAEFPAQPPNQPLAWFGIYDCPFLFDHRTGTFLHGEPPTLAHFRNSIAAQPSACPQLESALALEEGEYCRRVSAIQEKIRAGDIYQLNFTVPLRIHAPGSSAALYHGLRARQPAPHGAFLHTQPDRRILSFSPELFFRLENVGPTRRITTRPMKGTAPRGRTTAEDQGLAVWLQNDPKNRAENVMIVDLLRNDLGRISNYGAVRTQDLFAVERYPTLWQMTSTVTAELRPEVDFQQIFRALFPCGSITGAPKVRAMQLISRFEDHPRGVYTGAIGFFSKEETVFNVAIRTIELNGDTGSMGVGGGIVIDSDANEEFRECQLKAEFVTRSEEPFSLVESVLWQGGYPFLELHLDRLEDSAGYFGFACDREAIKTALLATARAIADDRPRKVRLLLGSDGSLEIEQEAISEKSDKQCGEAGRVRISTHRTDPGDPFFFHKTTHRPVYARALQAAKEAGFVDVIFLNMRGEVTEGAIGNIFIAKDGRWFTPPVSCGLLAGIYRRHLLETRADIEERILCLRDLETADAVYLTNAVRGLQRVTIDWQK